MRTVHRDSEGHWHWDVTPWYWRLLNWLMITGLHTVHLTSQGMVVRPAWGRFRDIWQGYGSPGFKVYLMLSSLLPGIFFGGRMSVTGWGLRIERSRDHLVWNWQQGTIYASPNATPSHATWIAGYIPEDMRQSANDSLHQRLAAADREAQQRRSSDDPDWRRRINKLG